MTGTAVELILGGVRSGKSREAQRRAETSGLEVIYIATATLEDEEMRRRVARHRRERPAGWTTIEEPLHLAAALEAVAGACRCVVIDCLTLWLSNCLSLDNKAATEFHDARHRLLEVLPSVPGRIIVVSNETNQGVIPMGELARRFCDEAGLLHQDIARLAERVTLMVAGLPVEIKRVGE